MASWKQVSLQSAEEFESKRQLLKASQAGTTPTGGGTTGRTSLGTPTSKAVSYAEIEKLFNKQLLDGFRKRSERRVRSEKRESLGNSSRLSLDGDRGPQSSAQLQSPTAGLIVCDSQDGDKLLAWQPDEQCLYVARLTQDGRKVTHLQVLVPTDPPMFDVDHILLSPQGRHLVLWGSRGVGIIQMPSRYGSYNLYDGGKSNILCRSWPLAERLFVTNKKLAVLKCVWHPTVSDEKSAILILTSDDVLRLFDLNQDPQTSTREINLATAYLRLTSAHLDAKKSDRIWLKMDEPINQTNRRLSQSPRSNHQPGIHSMDITGHGLGLGESPVSFDVGPPVSIQEAGSRRPSVGHPIYVLYSNGEVILGYLNIKSNTTSYAFAAVGPLVMHPSAEDNYGMDACDLIILKGQPQPVVVISTFSGQLYHCIPLENPSEAFKDQSGFAFPTPTLFIYETMEMGLSADDGGQNQGDDLVSIPIRLITDPTTPQRYFCVHPHGLHTVSLPFMEQFQHAQDVQHEFHEEQSVMEHLICTQPLQRGSGEGSESSASKNTPLGASVGFNRGKPFVVCLLSSGELLSRPLLNKSSTLESKSKESALKDLPSGGLPSRQITFERAMRDVLSRETNLPLFKRGSSSDQIDRASLELLLKSIDTIKREYLDRFELAADKIDRRVHSLTADKNIQLEELTSSLPGQLEDIWTRNEEYHERFIEVAERNDQLTAELDDFIDELQLAQCDLTDAERKMRSELVKMRNRLEELTDRIDLVRSKHVYQDRIRSTASSGTPDRSAPSMASPGKIQVNASQLEGLNQLLNEQNEQIAQLVAQVTQIKESLEI